MVTARYTLKDTKCGVNIATSITYHTEPIRDRSVETQLMGCHKLEGVQPKQLRTLVFLFCGTADVLLGP